MPWQLLMVIIFTDLCEKFSITFEENKISDQSGQDRKRNTAIVSLFCRNMYESTRVTNRSNVSTATRDFRTRARTPHT